MIVDLLDGNISVKSEPGEGTSFIVRFPVIRR
jgi:signal transduction histidine kinase